VNRRALVAGLGASVAGARSALAADPDGAGERALPLPDWPGQVVRPLAVFRCGPQPKGIALSPDGFEAWVTFLDGPPSVGVYALPGGRRLASLSLGDHGAVEATFRIDGRTVWVSQMETATVFEVDRRSRVVRRRFDAESDWSKVIEASPDGRRIYVSNWNRREVSEIDLDEGRTVRRLDTVDTPRGLYAHSDGRTLYVAGFGDGVLERIDLQTGAREALFQGVALRHVAADPQERALFITDMGGRCVWRHELATGRTARLCRTDPNPNTCALTPDGLVLCVSCRGPNGRHGYLADGPAWGSVLVVDAADGAVLDSIIGGNQCTALAVCGQTLVFSDFRDDVIRVYELPPHEELVAAGWPRRNAHARDVWKRGA
jgi:DNA-binding beta-propeller fold protein YncE